MIRNCFFTLVGFSLLASVAAGKEPQELFNGKDLSGWEGDPALWSAKDGAIVGQTTAEAPLKNNTFLIWKGGEVSDFKLTLQYRIQGGNSGVQYRSKVLDPKKWIVGGYQADIDSGPTYSGILYEERERGILAQRGQRVTIDRDGKKNAEATGDAAELQKAIHADDWNDYLIEARGARLAHTINGQLMSETTDRDRNERDKTGVLALQLHAGPPMTIQFRNIRLETLEPKAKKTKPGERKKT